MVRAQWKPLNWGLFLTAAVLLTACGTDETGSGDAWDTQERDSGVDADQGGVDAPDMAPEEDMKPAPDMKFAPDDVEAPRRPASVDTFVSASVVDAGDLLMVTCRLLDEEGEPLGEDTFGAMAGFDVQVAPREVLTKQASLEYQARSVGQASITCVSDGYGLIDLTPALVTVSPGPAAKVITELDRRSMSAGETVTATCKAFDEFGNEISDPDATIVTDIMGEGIEVAGNGVTITRADDYQVSCEIPGAAEVIAAPLEVTPSLPASLVIARVPDMMVYGLGQVITIETLIMDIYNNVIDDAPVSFSSLPDGNSFGNGRFRYNQEGLYTITAIVDPPTHMDMPLVQSVDVLINGTGPTIDCASPANGAQLDMAPGGTVMFSGTLSDVNGVMDVSVNGLPVTPDASGGFTAPIQTRYGINFVDVTATDSFGEENSRTCAFQVANKWTAPGDLEADALNLKLKRAAVDDGNRNNLIGGSKINSLADLLFTVLNSQGFVDTLDDAATGANPLYDACIQDTWVGCALSAKIKYEPDSLQLNGPNSVSLSLVNGGLEIDVRINNIVMGADIDYRAIGIPGSTDGDMTLSYLRVKLVSDLKMVNGKPSISLRPGTTVVESGNVSTSLSGIDGAIINLAVSLFQSTIRSLLRDELKKFVENDFNALLDDLVEGLDVSSLGSTFNIPRLDNGQDISLGFNVDFSNIEASTQRALFGLGVGFTGPVSKGITSLGAPSPVGATKLDPSVSKAVGVSIHVSVINQVLHALWRAGFFDAVIDGSTLGDGVPMGTQVSLETDLPPMIILQGGNKAKLHLGAIRMGVLYPGLFEDPLMVDIGATATTSFVLQNDELSFGNIQLDEFYFSTVDVSLDETTRDVLEGFLKSLIQNIVDSSLNDALPALPIPTFSMPASLSSYGLPVGAELGVYQPSLDSTQRHFILDGDFGIR